MNTVERVKALCKRKGIPVYKLEKDLGFSNGYIGQLKKGVLPDDRLEKVANYLGVSVPYLMNGEEAEGYYLNPETAEVAQKIFEDKNLRLLFDAAADATPEDLQLVHQMLLALKAKERPD